MKIIKENKTYPLITGNDIIVTKGSNILQTVDDALDNQQKEIDKLKSNMKYIYSYGGVGGNGTGGGGTSSGKVTTFVARLGGHKLENGGNSLILNGAGKYDFIVNVRDSNGQTFYVRYSVGGDMSRPQPLSTALNMCEFSTSLDLQRNGEIIVEFLDSDGGFLDSIHQGYIVNPHTFDVKFKYKYNNGQNEGVFDGNNECFIGDTSHTDPFVDISFRIDIPNVTNVQVKYDISDTDTTSNEETTGHGTKAFGTTTDISNDHFKIYLENLLRNGEKFLQESNTGNYTVTVKLSYSASGSNVEVTPLTFKFTIIPNYLYINVRNSQDLLYNSFEELIIAKSEGIATEDEGGIPEKNITEGSYASFYCKVYEGDLKTTPEPYTIECKVYNYIGEIDGSESDDTIHYDETNFDLETPAWTGSLTVTEQIESSVPFSIPFGTFGIKKIVFKPDHSKNGIDVKDISTVKYIYVRKSVESVKWYPDDIEMDNYYFRANNGDETYSPNFPELSSGTQPLELKISNKNTTVIRNPLWETIPNNCNTTIISFGLQYSQINSESSEILRTYATNTTETPDNVLCSDHIFTTSGEICIPYEPNYDKSDSKKYHLVQIVRTELENGSGEYGTYLYIDGIPETVGTSTYGNNLYVGKIVLNNVNVTYNLINVQYINKGEYAADELIYQYWLKYKERMRGDEISESERSILNCFNNHSIVFDGTSVILEESTVKQIAPKMPIPTMMMEYTNSDESVVTKFEEALFKGYNNGDNGVFGTRFISVHWCDGLKKNATTELHEILIPTMSGGLTGSWFVELQGTSTMKNRIKNFSVGIQTESNDNNEKILVSPNYDADDPSTFFPEQIWTIKADIADSAHANNTSIGRFVNKVCTRFQTGQSYSEHTAKYIKNTLEGFPIMMYFKLNNRVFYLGVYNFNMGRNSYYNLGYYKPDDTEDMIGNIVSSTTGDDFSFSRGRGFVNEKLAIGEIQENLPQFDFHQYDERTLFQDENSNVVKMFGKDSKITFGKTVGEAKETLRKFVEQVAVAGAYCFANIDKEPVSSKSDEYNSCIDRYAEVNQVPDIKWQMKYDALDNLTWEDMTNDGLTFDIIKDDEDNLLKCIYDTLSDGNINAEQRLDYTSASEYYTICMAFGLIDSVLKNMNIKSWDGQKCYITFYDMDCALQEDNNGNESVSYLAATDYWYSNNENGYLSPVTINWDYWDNTVGKGFDCKSSYLFAIVKYAQPLLKKLGKNLTHYPQEFWAILRQPDGELRSADYFVDNYFKSGIGSIPTYMASMNYHVKYMYKGTTLDGNGNETAVRYLANAGAFHGSRVFKVKDWLRKRLHFLDAMFNVQAVSIPISQSVFVPIPTDTTLMNNLKSNPDVTILQDAFTTDTSTSSLMASNGVLVDMYAPMNTPIVMVLGTTSQIYLLSEGVGKPNPIVVNVPQPAITIKSLGSTELTNISKVEPLLTSANQVVSDKIEEIKYGGSVFPAYSNSFLIQSTSVKNIDMSIPGFSGELRIISNGTYGHALSSLNISNSGFYGTWDHLENLQELNISGINTTGVIGISNCELLTGEKCHISGVDADHLTTLKTLQISGVSGNFVLENTSIEEINISIDDKKYGEFVIDGDARLQKLTLTGFGKIEIKNCPKLTTLNITGDTKCKSIIIDVPNKYDNYIEKFNSEVDGVFDFTRYTSLEEISLSGCPGVEVIRIPDHEVKVKTFKNNQNLEFVDTPGKDSVIALTEDSTFYMCPRYGMRQSWSKKEGKSLIRTRMCIDKNCTSLAHTFDKGIEGKTKYIGSTKYKNLLNQNVVNASIDMAAAEWFINTVVCGGELDDTYITDSGTVSDETESANGKKYGVNCCENITSLQGCFRLQSDMSYSGATSDRKKPILSDYISLTDVAGMYQNTGVKYLDSNLLSFPYELNSNESPLVDWRDFIGSGNLNISKDALKNISYRLDELSSVVFTVKEGGTSGELYSDIDMIDILQPIEYTGDGVEGEDYIVWNGANYAINKRLKSFTSFYINSSQNVDYTRMFELCPNVESLIGFLMCDLSKANITGMLKPCKNLRMISDSFNHIGNIESAPTIDLYDFFDWDSNVNMTSLFEISTTNNTVGFSLNKTVSYEHFKEILGKLGKYQNLRKLSNIFSYCTISDYNPDEEIRVFDDDNPNGVVIMSDIISVDSLFYNCKGVNNSGDDVPLNIRRSLFKSFPNVSSVANTFAGTHFRHMLTYDFFCKYRPVIESSNIYVKVGDEYKSAKLNTFNYGSNPINNMYGCFQNVKFYYCKSWFDEHDIDNDMLKPKIDTLEYNGSVYESDTYYTKEGGVWIGHKITSPVAISDTQNNFTNYVSSIATSNNYIIDNHNISGDLLTYGNGSDVYEENEYNIYPVHCCLPPDIFHACYNTCNLTNVFANTNIIGVIPQHLVMKCYNGIFKDMLLNTNILPNVLYHYEKSKSADEAYLSMISDIDVDDETIMIMNSSDDVVYTLDETVDACVLFRNKDGVLKRRHPSTVEHSKSQFVYVPQGYTTNANLMKAFTFRYNLPSNTNLDSAQLDTEYGITWNAGGYGNDYSPENKPELWPYYVQYFFLGDESVSWKSVIDMKYPFISDIEDADFETREYRKFSTEIQDASVKNIWCPDRENAQTKVRWTTMTNGVFNVFLDLCGERNIKTGEYVDCGCMINKSIENRHYPKLDSFVSGNLAIFLNGKVFDGLDAGKLSSLNIEGSKIIIFSSFGKNIILPYLRTLPYPTNPSLDPKVVLEYNGQLSQFYEFMFQYDSESKYVERYFNNEGSKYVATKTENGETIYKYRVI